MLAVDCSIRLTADTAKALKAAGVVAVGRYLGEWDKCMTSDEVSAITSAGLFIWSIYEGDPTSADYFTYAQGVTDAVNAVKAAVSVSQPPGPIYFTVDYDAQEADLGRIRDYVNGVRSAIGAYKVGLYGSYLVVTSIDADYKWQTVAWSNGQIASVHLYQRQDDVQLAGVDVDMNDVYQNPGWWPTPKENSMDTLQRGATGDEVKTLQIDLNLQPFNPKLDVDGVFGVQTDNAVRVFERENQLQQTGKVDATLWETIERITFPTVNAQVNGQPMEAHAVRDVTYVLWTALDVFKTSYTYKGNGLMTIGETDVQGYIIHGDTFLPWDSLTPGIQAEPLPEGGFNFVVPSTKPVSNKPAPTPQPEPTTPPTPAPAPTPAPSPTPVPTTDGREVVAVIQGDKNGDTFYFTPEVKMPDGTFSGMGKMLLDTGAACMLIDQSMATAFSLPKGNTTTIGGVTGSAQAYETTVTLKFGDTVFENQFAIVDPSYAGWDNGLFGLKFFVDNGLDFELDLDTSQLILFKKVTQ